jgi:hypothetical protein
LIENLRRKFTTFYLNEVDVMPEKAFIFLRALLMIVSNDTIKSTTFISIPQNHPPMFFGFPALQWPKNL